MDKEQAIDLLDNLIGMIEDNQDNDYDTAFRMAIDALKAQLSLEDATSDTISRQQAVDAVKKNTFRLTFAEEQNCEGHVAWSANAVYSDVMEGALLELPSAQPEKRTEKRTETHGVCLDAISRKPAIDALDKQIKQCCKALGSLSLSDVDKHAVEVEMASIRAYRKMLENLSTVQPEPQWIPVSERLPEDMQFVLLTVRRLKNEYNPGPFISVGYIGWNHQHWWCAHDGDCEISKVEVLAWMPLPEPYKPNKKQSGKEEA